MNTAQKKTCSILIISLATLTISAAVIWYAWTHDITLLDIHQPLGKRLLRSIAAMLPLILIVVIDKIVFKKKDYDERDKDIERKSMSVGYISAFVFLLTAGFFLIFIAEPLNTTTNIYIFMRFCFLVYLAYFVSSVATSIATLLQYRLPADTNTCP